MMQSLMFCAQNFKKQAELFLYSETPKDYFIRQWNFSNPESTSKDVFWLTGNQYLGTKIARMQSRIQNWQDKSAYNLFQADYLSFSDFGTSNSLSSSITALLQEIKEYHKFTSNSEELKSKFPHLFGFLQFLIFYIKMNQKWANNELISISDWSILLSINHPDKIKKRLLDLIDGMLGDELEKKSAMLHGKIDLEEYFKKFIPFFEYNFSDQFIDEEIAKIKQDINNMKRSFSNFLKKEYLIEFQTELEKIIDELNNPNILNVNRVKSNLEKIPGLIEKIKEHNPEDESVGVQSAFEFAFINLQERIEEFHQKFQQVLILEERRKINLIKFQQLKRDYKKLFSYWLSTSKTSGEFFDKLTNFIGLVPDICDSLLGDFGKFKSLVNSYIFERKNFKPSSSTSNQQTEEDLDAEYNKKQFFIIQRNRLSSQHNGTFLPELIRQLDFYAAG